MLCSISADRTTSFDTAPTQIESGKQQVMYKPVQMLCQHTCCLNSYSCFSCSRICCSCCSLSLSGRKAVSVVGSLPMPVSFAALAEALGLETVLAAMLSCMHDHVTCAGNQDDVSPQYASHTSAITAGVRISGQSGEQLCVCRKKVTCQGALAQGCYLDRSTGKLMLAIESTVPGHMMQRDECRHATAFVRPVNQCKQHLLCLRRACMHE